MPTIKKIISKEAGLRPVLVDFQNGKIKADKGDNVESSVYKDNHGKVMVGVTNGDMLYTGVVESDDLYSNFLLVHSKTKNRIKLIQIDYCTVSPLLQKKNNLMNVTVATNVSSLSDLNKQFGSKRAKRSTEQRERLTMNINAVKEQLEKTVADVKVDETDIAPSENDSLYRPRINRDASTIDQVYNLEDLVPKSVLDTLSEEALLIAKSNELNEYNLCSFAASNISKILESSAEEGKIYRIAINLYINYLLKFMHTPVKNITKKFVICEKSPEVNGHILDSYSLLTKNSRTRPLSMRDKALCSILVLTALTMDYQVDIESLSQDFKIGLKKITEISKILAFTLGKNKSIITLKLPLPQPVSLSLKRKRK